MEDLKVMFLTFTDEVDLAKQNFEEFTAGKKKAGLNFRKNLREIKKLLQPLINATKEK